MHTFVVLAYKESSYLEECIKSVLNQKYSSKVVIATSTPNEYIQNIADKYLLEIMVNPNPGQGIGYDFDFAISCGDTNLTTIAHQDDIYDYEYSNLIVKAYKENPNALIVFSDYYEIRNEGNVYSNTNLRIKRILLLPMKNRKLSSTKFGKRLILRFGNAISCPAVTFVKNNINTNDIFKCDFVCDVDWYAWEKLSLKKGKFSYVGKPLMGHRVHEESTTTEIINERIRTKEDLIMFQKFWPNSISRFINKFYVKAEDSNN
ncbi:glycosyltransferase family A protein [Thomasclavelia sp.]